MTAGFPYTQNFCEENVWHLGRRLCPPGMANPRAAPRMALPARDCPPRDPGEFEVLILAGRQPTVPIFAQKKGSFAEPVWWDYHVILMDRGQGRMLDLDSLLEVTCTIEEYVSATFRPSLVYPPEWRCEVRAVPLTEYLARFHSDRSHMLGPDGRPLSPFPAWPPILCHHRPLTLAALRDPHGEIEGIAGFKPWPAFFGFAFNS